MIYLQLFVSFLQIGMFSIGGGYAALPLIQNQVVDLHKWLTLGEFTDLITISQMTPGPIAINAATFVGIQIGGFPGAIVATLGCIVPSCLIVSLLTYIYLKYRKLTVLQNVLDSLRPAVVALIASAGVTILVTALWGPMGFMSDPSKLKLQSALIFLFAILLLRKFKLNPIIVMIICGGLQVGVYYLLPI